MNRVTWSTRRGTSWALAALCFVLVLMVLTPSVTRATEELRFPYPIQTKVLGNGLTLVMIPMPTPGVVHYQTVVRAGSRNEVEPGRTGYAHFFEHMMFRGTARHPEADYRETLDMLGADGNASTGPDQTSYYMTLPAAGIAKVIELEADRFQNLSYSREQFKKEAGAVLGEYLINRASPDHLLEERRLALAFRKHPYGHTVVGYEADVRAMPEGYEYSRLFHHNYYRPEECVLLVVGDFDSTQVENLVRTAYGDWPRGARSPEIPEEPPLHGPVREDLFWEGPARPVLEISFRVPAYSEGDAATAALAMIREVYFGPTSDLYRELVVDRRVSESIEAEHNRARDPYLFTVTTRLRDVSDFETVRDRILSVLEDAGANPVDPGRLEAARRRAKASLMLRLETPGGVCWALSDFIALTGDLRSLERYYARMAALTPQDLADAASAYLIPGNSITLTLRGKEGRP